MTIDDTFLDLSKILRTIPIRAYHEDYNLKIANAKITFQSHFDILGMKFDNKRTLTPYISSLKTSLVAQRLRMIRRLSLRMPKDTLQTMAEALFYGKLRVNIPMVFSVSLGEPMKFKLSPVILPQYYLKRKEETT